MGEESIQWPNRIADLHRQGLVTHILSPPDIGIVWSIDPTTVRDMAGLSLLVIFGDGSVAVSCPDGLPCVLEGMATPLDDAAANISGLIDQKDITEVTHTLSQAEGHDTTSATIELGNQALAGGDMDAMAAILSRLDHITTGQQQLMDRVIAAESRTVADIPASVQLVLADAVHDILTTVHGLSQAVSVMHGSVDKAIADKSSQSDLAAAVDDLLAAMRADRSADTIRSDAANSRIHQRLNKMESAQQTVDLTCLTQGIALLTSQIDRISANLDASVTAGGLNVMAQRVLDMMQSFDRLGGADGQLSALSDQLEQFSRQMLINDTRLSSTNAATQDDIDNIGLRRHIVRQGLIQSQLLRRLDAVLELIDPAAEGLRSHTKDIAGTEAVGNPDTWLERLATLDSPTRLSIAEFIAGRMQHAAKS